MNRDIVTKLDKNVEYFINQIISRYEIDKSELISIWGEVKINKSPEKKVEIKNEKSEEKKEKTVIISEEPADLLKLSKDALAAICKSHGLKVSGKKEELLNRILEFKKKSTDKTDEKNKDIPREKSKEIAAKSKTTKKLIKHTEPDVIKNANLSLTIQIKRNKFGNFEHFESGLIFDKDDKVVIGRQEGDGTIIDLTDDDIMICKKFKFNFKMPENLDKNKKLDIKIKEIEDMTTELTNEATNDDMLDDDIEEEEELEEDEEQETEDF
jgi:hypothetical protein